MDKIDDLKRSVDRLSREAGEIRRELARKTRLLWVVMVGGFIGTVMLIVAGYAVTLSNTQAIDDNNQKLCPMLRVFIPLPGDPQPDTPRGRLIVERIKGAMSDLHC